MEAASYSIGDIVEVFCERCRLNLDASVSALTDEQPVKVTCRTCHNEVKYRVPRDFKGEAKKKLARLIKRKEKEATEAQKAAPKPTYGNPLRAVWDELTDKVDSRHARVYDATATYKKDDAILHKKLGMGIVHEIDADGEMNVLFRKGFSPLPSGQEPGFDE
ncbi:MAG: hypothetical protein ACI9WU_001138 [Myxococcota bacterium]|jgi:hypothetical protein